MTGAHYFLNALKATEGERCVASRFHRGKNMGTPEFPDLQASRLPQCWLRSRIAFSVSMAC